MISMHIEKPGSRRSKERCSASCAPKSEAEAEINISKIGYALDVCLIVFYVVNLLLVLSRLIKNSRTEFSDSSTD
jgi:hypothetical protein